MIIKYLDAIARIMHPHWAEDQRGTYSPEQLVEKVAQLARDHAALTAERERLIGERDAALSELRQGQCCWHCKVGLIVDRPRCETCPAECDAEDCQADGCVEAEARKAGAKP